MSSVLALALLLSISSCANSKNDTLEEDRLLNETLNVPVLNIEEVVAVGQELMNNISKDDLIQGSLTRSHNSSNELVARAYLMPIINSGIIIHTDVISMIEKNNWWGEFTAEERVAIRNFDEAQLAELSLIFSHLKFEAPYNTRGEVMGCLARALLGIGGGVSWYVGGTVGLMTAKTAITVIKHLAKRSLGIIGVVLTVYDFVECMNE